MKGVGVEGITTVKAVEGVKAVEDIDGPTWNGLKYSALLKRK